MIVSTILLSTAYLPPISWLSALIRAENILIEAHETYPKQTYRNRCRIATSAGELNLTVPVNKVYGNHTITSDINIDNSTNWKRLHWRSISTAYNKSPYFLFYRDMFEPIFNTEHYKLLDLNHELLTTIIQILRLEKANIKYTDTYEANPLYPDMRSSFHPKANRDLNISVQNNRYIQVFEESIGFLPDLSCIDLLFNLGPEALTYLNKTTHLYKPE